MHGGHRPGRSVAKWDGSPEEITATVKIFNNQEEYNKYERENPLFESD